MGRGGVRRPTLSWSKSEIENLKFFPCNIVKPQKDRWFELLTQKYLHGANLEKNETNW